MNQVVLVGRLVKDVEIVELDNGKKCCELSLAVSRNYKNSEGKVDTDFIDCVMWDNIASKVSEYCKKGDCVGIRGILQSSSYKDKDGNSKYRMQVVADRVTFLSSKVKNVDKDKKDYER